MTNSVATPKHLHFTAASKDISWEEARIMKRARFFMPDWQVSLWDDDDNDKIFEQAFPNLIDRFKRIRFGVMKADLARYAYMKQFGGWYLDTDYKLLRPISPELMKLDCVIPIEDDETAKYGFHLGNAVFGSSKGYPFWGDFVEHVFSASAPDELTDHIYIPSMTGPLGITKFYLDNKHSYPGLHTPEKRLFHPDRSMFGLQHDGGPETVGIHLCWGSWRGKTPIKATTNFLRRKLTAAL